MDKSKIGQFLKSLRIQKGKKQFQVAMELSKYGIKVSDKTVAKWEKGNFPDLEKLKVIAEYYGVQASDILNGEVYVQQNFADKYFIVNNDWMQHYPPDKLYQIRVDQEQTIKARVKALFMELIENKSLTAMQNEELNFLLTNFYSVSDYAIQLNSELNTEGYRQTQLLRYEIYREILSMHDSSVEEIYWEIKKLFNYNKRLTFEKNICDYEDDKSIVEGLLRKLDDWEKDLLLAQVQTTDITHRYGEYSPLTYLRQFGRDYDVERTTKEGIKLLIDCGARLNPFLLGYRLFNYDCFSIMPTMERLHAKTAGKILISAYDEKLHKAQFYWADNTTKNRLIDLYYTFNCRRPQNEKLSLEKVYDLFINNEDIPEWLLLDIYKKYARPNLSRKEQLLEAKLICAGEIAAWDECKEQEARIEQMRRELNDLEKQWNKGEQIAEIEYSDWVGEKEDVLTENDILMRLSEMSYSQYVASRRADLTAQLLEEIDILSLTEIREKYFPIEVKYEKL